MKLLQVSLKIKIKKKGGEEVVKALRWFPGAKGRNFDFMLPYVHLEVN